MRYYVILILAILYGCQDDDDNNNVIIGEDSVFDYVEEAEDLSILEEALIRTDLEFTLTNPGRYTVFAPTDAAFEAYFQEQGISSIQEMDVDELREMLFYHILNLELEASDFGTAYQKTIAIDNEEDLGNLDMFILENQDAEIILNGEVLVTEVDNRANNGVLHEIDGVLELPTLGTFVRANPVYSNLETALEQQGLLTLLDSNDDTADPASPFTLFIPANDAFETLIADDPNLNDIADVLALPDLSNILQTHLISASRLRADNFEEGDLLDTVAGNQLALSIAAGITITAPDGTQTTILNQNITATNGIAHVVEMVLLP